MNRPTGDALRREIIETNAMFGTDYDPDGDDPAQALTPESEAAYTEERLRRQMEKGGAAMATEDAIRARMEEMASGAIDHERQINLGRRIGAGVYEGLTDATRDGGEGVTVEYLRLLVACDMAEGYRRHGISTEEQLLAHPWEVRAQAHRVSLWRQVDGGVSDG